MLGRKNRSIGVEAETGSLRLEPSSKTEVRPGDAFQQQCVMSIESIDGLSDHTSPDNS
jgi:hypothetical protein